MKNLGSLMIAMPIAAAVIIGSVACAQNDQKKAAEPATRSTGSMQRSAAGSMMDHMQEMHGRFQEMGDQSYWMRGGSAMPGSQHMTALSGNLATMTEGMRGAMGQMLSLREQSQGEGSLYAQHLQQMQQHMQSMSEQLDAMAEIMPRIREGEAEEQPMGQMGSMGSMEGSMGSMMDHMQQMHGRFQEMGDQSYWMHGGSAMPDSQYIMALSGNLATMTEAMHGAMGQMQSLWEQSQGEGSPYAQHLQQMQQHMQSMSQQLDEMSQTMQSLRKSTEK